MIVQCIANSRNSLKSESSLSSFQENISHDEVSLVIGQRYLVHGIIYRGSIPWYLICEETDDDYPKPHIADLFRILDDRVPPGWGFTLKNGNAGGSAILPVQWVRDHHFLEKLVDEVPTAVNGFRELRKQLAVWHDFST